MADELEPTISLSEINDGEILILWLLFFVKEHDFILRT